MLAAAQAATAQARQAALTARSDAKEAQRVAEQAGRNLQVSEARESANTDAVEYGSAEARSRADAYFSNMRESGRVLQLEEAAKNLASKASQCEADAAQASNTEARLGADVRQAQSDVALIKASGAHLAEGEIAQIEARNLLVQEESRKAAEEARKKAEEARRAAEESQKADAARKAEEARKAEGKAKLVSAERAAHEAVEDLMEKEKLPEVSRRWVRRYVTVLNGQLPASGTEYISAHALKVMRSDEVKKWIDALEKVQRPEGDNLFGPPNGPGPK
jgi:hypothetical protein